MEEFFKKYFTRIITFFAIIIIVGFMIKNYLSMEKNQLEYLEPNRNVENKVNQNVDFEEFGTYAEKNTKANKVSDKVEYNKVSETESKQSLTVSHLSKESGAIKSFRERTITDRILGFWKEGNGVSCIYIVKGNYYYKTININTKEISETCKIKIENSNNYILECIANHKLTEGTVELNEYTDYYKIESNGDLGLYDRYGLFEKYSRLKFN